DRQEAIRFDVRGQSLRSAARRRIGSRGAIDLGTGLRGEERRGAGSDTHREIDGVAIKKPAAIGAGVDPRGRAVVSRVEEPQRTLGIGPSYDRPTRGSLPAKLEKPRAGARSKRAREGKLRRGRSKLAVRGGHQNVAFFARPAPTVKQL